MKTDIPFIETLNEFVDHNIDTSDELIKTMVDDFCDYPGPEDAEGEEREFKLNRNSLLQQFKQRIDDTVIAHRYVMAQYNFNAEQIAPKFEEMDKEFGGMFTQLLKEGNAKKISECRLGFKNFTWVCETLNSKQIADEQLIISLWATTEKYLKQILIIKGMKKKDIKFNWELLKKIYENYNINLEKLPSYEVVNEVRIKNNKIKHDFNKREVNSEQFTEFDGLAVSNEEYDVHKYALHTYHFMNRVVMSLGPIVSYAPDR